MIRKIFISLLKRYKNSDFKLDEKVSSSDLLFVIFNLTIMYLRGFLAVHKKKRFSFTPIGKNVTFGPRKGLNIGNHTKIEDGVHLYGLSNCEIKIGNRCRIGAHSRIIVTTNLSDATGYISIGNDCGIGEFSYLGGAGGVTIGNDCIIGQYFSIHPENHNFDDNNNLIRKQGLSRNGVSIGNNCWIGSKVTFLDGSSVGDGCVIAAGSVVTKRFGDNVVLGGLPARIMKNR